MTERLDETIEIEEIPSLIQTMIPNIYEGPFPVPSHFNAITLFLNGKMESDLDWKEAKTLAKKAQEQNKMIVWDLDLGLFDHLQFPLSNQPQFSSLVLSLNHFKDHLWEEFRSITLGLSIYRGTFDVLARQKEAAEYLELLADHLPGDLPLLLFLDVSNVAEEQQLDYLNPARWHRFYVFSKGATLPFNYFGWGIPTSKGYSGIQEKEIPLPSKEPLHGICLPKEGPFDSLLKAISFLRGSGFPFKIISEQFLTAQWDGLDYLFYSGACVTFEEKRKLLGFAAAGGALVSTNQLIGLPNEILLENIDYHPQMG